MSDKKIIATHSGKYHTDDLFAVATLQLLLGIENVEIVRTRDKEVIQQADYVVDVGGAHEPDSNRFDHHQAAGGGLRENGVPYAAFGLVWKTYGEKLAGGAEEAGRIDAKLVQPIDAADNGFSLYELSEQKIPPYTIQTMLNSLWKKPDEEKEFDEIFLETLPLIRKILSREIELAKFYVQAERDVKDVYEASERKDVIVFPKDAEYGRELIGGVLCAYPEPLFAVLYRPDQGVWQTAAIKKEPYTFENRKRFPEEWGGNKTQEELQKLTGFDDVVFVHRAGFMAVSESKETAIALAQKALEM